MICILSWLRENVSEETHPVIVDSFCLDCTIVESDANGLQGISIARRENLLYKIRFMTGNAAEVIYYGWIKLCQKQNEQFPTITYK